jgi:hypothetical protein
MKNKTVNVSIPYNGIKKELAKMINHANKKIIVEVIMGCLDKTEVGIESLYLAFSGISIQSTFKKGEKILVKWYDTPSWKFNKEQTKAAGLLLKDEQLTATVIGFDPYVGSNLQIEITAVNDNGETVTCDNWVRQSNVISLKEKFPFEDEEEIV